MKQIKCLAKDIREELEGAEHYAKLSVQYKDTDKALADTYAKMSEAELGHVDQLHAQAVRLIKEQRAAGVEAPAAMQAVWDWEHEQQIDTVARIRALLDSYKRQ